MSDDVQQRMRHDHAICMMMAAYVYSEHAKGKVLLDSEAFQNHLQTITSESDLDFKFVSGAFKQIIEATGLIPVRAACTALGKPGPEIPVTHATGSIVKTETAVFKEFCVELMLKHDRGKFVVYDRGFVAMLRKITTDLDYDAREVSNTMIEVYLAADHRHLRDVAEKALALLKEEKAAEPEVTHLRLAAGE